MYVEDFKRGTNKDIGPKDIFEMGSSNVIILCYLASLCHAGLRDRRFSLFHERPHFPPYLSDLDEHNTQGNDEAGQETEKTIGFFEHKDTHKDGKEGSALPDAGCITDVCDLQAETVGNVGEEKQNPSQKNAEEVMPVAI